MINTKINLSFKDYLIILILLLSIVIIYFSEDIISQIKSFDTSVEESQKASADIAKLVLSLDKISLDTSILNLPYLQNVRPLPQFPVDITSPGIFGKTNPFVGSLNSSLPAATTTQIGGVQYAAQRDQGTASVRTVNVSQPR